MGGGEVSEWAEKGWPGVSEPLPNARLRVLSLGAGVQSSTLALMAARGEIGPMPDCAIFADTQSEPSSVYRQLEWLISELPFPVHIFTKGSLRQEILDASMGIRPNHNRPPLFVMNKNSGRVGFTKRQCTRDFKVYPIRAKVRELLGLKKGQRSPKSPVVEQWIGISSDEMQRMKISPDRFIYLRHPLIEARMNRKDCLRWLADRQYPTPPKSACTFCTFHDNAAWRDMRDNDPASWADAIKIDAAIRASGRHKGMRELGYLHRSLKPLAEAPIDLEESIAGDLFAEDCEGMCGV